MVGSMASDAILPVGAILAVEHAVVSKRAIREKRPSEEVEALQARGRPGVGELGHPPLDRPLGDPAAGVVGGGQGHLRGRSSGTRSGAWRST